MRKLKSILEKASNLRQKGMGGTVWNSLARSHKTRVRKHGCLKWGEHSGGNRRQTEGDKTRTASIFSIN